MRKWKKSSSLLNEDASIINKEQPIEIEWPKNPHFYKKGKIIVQYIGEDKEIVTDLDKIMGKQFAGIK